MSTFIKLISCIFNDDHSNHNCEEDRIKNILSNEEFLHNINDKTFHVQWIILSLIIIIDMIKVVIPTE